MMKPMYNKEDFLEDFKTRKNSYKSNKVLTEDVSVNSPTDEEVQRNVSINMISDLIRRTWDNIDALNNYIIQLNIAGCEKLVPIIEEMISDSYIHVGQLEKALELPAPEAEQIQDGREDFSEDDDNDDDEELESEDDEELESEEDEDEDIEDYPDDVKILSK